MNKNLGVLFFSLLIVGCLNGSCYDPKNQSHQHRFTFFKVDKDKQRSKVTLNQVIFDDEIYEIYDEAYAYGFYRCIAPNVFAHVENINLVRKRYLNVQTGECFDVEAIYDY